jgi:hypothetical protein
MRLPLPSLSVNRYQYSVDGLSPAASTRHVQSDSAETLTGVWLTTRVKATSSATSTWSRASFAFSKGRRVHKMTLSGCGSAEATPSAYRSRRSRQGNFEAAGALRLQASSAPIAEATSRNSRRVIVGMAA